MANNGKYPNESVLYPRDANFNSASVLYSKTADDTFVPVNADANGNLIMKTVEDISNEFVPRQIDIAAGNTAQLIDIDDADDWTIIYISNTSMADTLWIGPANNYANLVDIGHPLYPGQTYITRCKGNLWGANLVGAAGAIDIRILEER